MMDRATHGAAALQPRTNRYKGPETRHALTPTKYRPGTVVSNEPLKTGLPLCVFIGVSNGPVDVAFSGGDPIRADHVILATGYQADLTRVPMVAPGLPARIKTHH